MLDYQKNKNARLPKKTKMLDYQKKTKMLDYQSFLIKKAHPIYKLFTFNTTTITQLKLLLLNNNGSASLKINKNIKNIIEKMVSAHKNTHHTTIKYGGQIYANNQNRS